MLKAAVRRQWRLIRLALERPFAIAPCAPKLSRPKKILLSFSVVSELVLSSVVSIPVTEFSRTAGSVPTIFLSCSVWVTASNSVMC